MTSEEDKGIYLVKPVGDHLRIIFNKNDAKKRKDPSKILKVNNKNLKFGKCENFERRYKDYQTIFGDNVDFKIILKIKNKSKLERFENLLKTKFIDYCLLSPNNNQSMEWMENITFEKATKIILDSYKEFE